MKQNGTYLHIHDMKALVEKMTKDALGTWLGRSIEELLIRLKPYGICILLPHEEKGRKTDVNLLSEVKLICKNKESKFYNKILIIK